MRSIAPPSQRAAHEGLGRLAATNCAGAWRAGAAPWLLGITALVLSGCMGESLDETYGRRSGVYGGSSVNGTAVLGGMFQQRGHSVTSARILSKRLRDSADVIVWFPDDDGKISPEVREWLEDWLWSAPDRRLIYVGRDYDAAPHYWKEVEPQVTAAQATVVKERRAQANANFTALRTTFPKKEHDNLWFRFNGKQNSRAVTTLSGPWSTGIDASKVAMELNGRLLPPKWAGQPRPKPTSETDRVVDYVDGYEPLLTSGGDVIVGRIEQPTWDSSQIIFVANGSFLLNYPLINHEHRHLAGRLVESVPEHSAVVFLESGSGGPQIGARSNPISQFQILHEWPMNFILLHAAVLGILYCFWRLPIFGRPALLPREATGDFGLHIKALGRLLALTQGYDYAMARLKHYQRHVRKDSGTASEEPAAPESA